MITALILRQNNNDSIFREKSVSVAENQTQISNLKMEFPYPAFNNTISNDSIKNLITQLIETKKNLSDTKNALHAAESKLR